MLYKYGGGGGRGGNIPQNAEVEIQMLLFCRYSMQYCQVSSSQFLQMMQISIGFFVCFFFHFAKYSDLLCHVSGPKCHVGFRNFAKKNRKTGNILVFTPGEEVAGSSITGSPQKFCVTPENMPCRTMRCRCEETGEEVGKRLVIGMMIPHLKKSYLCLQFLFICFINSISIIK